MTCAARTALTSRPISAHYVVIALGPGGFARTEGLIGSFRLPVTKKYHNIHFRQPDLIQSSYSVECLNRRPTTRYAFPPAGPASSSRLVKPQLKRVLYLENQSRLSEVTAKNFGCGNVWVIYPVRPLGLGYVLRCPNLLTRLHFVKHPLFLTIIPSHSLVLTSCVIDHSASRHEEPRRLPFCFTITSRRRWLHISIPCTFLAAC